MHNKKQWLILIAALIGFTILIASCDSGRRKQVPKTEKVSVYHVHNSVDNTWLYYYLMHDSNTRNYYYASSPTPISSYSSVHWTRSSVAPSEIKELELMQEQEIEVTDLGNEVTVQLELDYSTIPSEIDTTPGADPSFDTTPDTGGDTGGGGGSPD